MPADASKCSPSTDAGLTETFASKTLVDAIPDDRLFTVAEVAALLRVSRSAIYRACDGGDLAYGRAVQVEGRDLKDWLRATAQPVEP